MYSNWNRDDLGVFSSAYTRLTVYDRRGRKHYDYAMTH